MPEKIGERVNRAIGEKVFPGCVIGIIKNDERTIFPFGAFTYESKTRVSTDTMYDVASITKSIPTASLALLLIEEGSLRLSDPVAQHLPELRNHHDATIEDLLRYRVTGVQMSGLKGLKPRTLEAHIMEHGFAAPPGESSYTNLPAFLLGLIIERASSETLDTLADARFFRPLGMSRTTFFAKFFSRDEIAPTEVEEWRGLLQGTVHDESAYVFSVEGERAVGHAGLFSTAHDLLQFADALLSGRYPAIVAGAQIGLGWQLHEEYFMGAHCGQKTFGKTGFTGTSIVLDAARGIALVILSNRTYPERPLDAFSRSSAINAVRRDVADIVFE